MPRLRSDAQETIVDVVILRSGWEYIPRNRGLEGTPQTAPPKTGRNIKCDQIENGLTQTASSKNTRRLKHCSAARQNLSLVYD